MEALLLGLVIGLFLGIVFSHFFNQNKNDKIETFHFRACLLEAMVKDNFQKFLTIFQNSKNEVFHLWTMNSRVSQFISRHIDVRTFSIVYEAWKAVINLDNADETLEVLEEAFRLKRPAFWSHLYFEDFINQNAEKADDYKSLIKILGKEFEKEVSRQLLFDFNRFYSDMMHVSQIELSQKLEEEIARLKLVLEK